MLARMLTRRTVLLGTAGVVGAGVAGAAVGVHEGVLPGRPEAQALFGLNGEPGVVPDVAPGPVETGSFTSARRLGAETSWVVVRPPGSEPGEPLPLVVALHALGWTVANLVADEALALPRFLAAAVAAGVPPFAIAAADGGRSYWHPRPNGEDASAMVTEELLPLLAARGLPTERVGLLGWSMGGYGSLRLAGLLGADRAPCVAAVSPALWTDPDDASTTGFTDAADYEASSVLGHQEELSRTRVRLECGTGDPFYRAVEDYADGFPEDADVSASFEPGAHDSDYWRRVLPGQLAFLGAGVTSTG